MPPGPPADHRLPRARRLHHRRDFDQLKAQGGRLVEGCMIVNWLPRPAGAESRLGIVTSRKLGQAVVRSRARRLLRECFRQHRPNFRQPLDLVLVARQGIVGKKLPDVNRDFLKALRRAGLLRLASPPESSGPGPAPQPQS
jgi:ribonuclease P protein component